MEIPAIKDFVPFLKKCLNASQILNYETKFLTKPGDNYGSIMLLLTVRYQTNENGGQKTLSLVAKTPIRNESLKLVFKPHQTCIKENGFYTDAIPEMLQLQRDAGIPESKLCSVFVHCYGARSSLDPNAIEADEDAVLLLENLKISGYEIGDRITGFPSQIAYTVIEKLAQFHALPIAVRTLRLDRFNEKIRPYLDRWFNDDWDMVETAKVLVSAINEIEWDKDDESIRDRFISHIESYPDTLSTYKVAEDGPFTSIHHQDLWVNNILVKFDPTRESIENVKFVDYQVIHYESIALDIIFFLFSSVQPSELDANFDKLLRHYYDHFCKTLKDVGCSSDEYTFDKFLTEVKTNAKFEMFHIIMMMRPLMSRKIADSDLSAIDNKIFLEKDIVDSDFYVRIKSIILLFNKYGLLP